MARRAALALLIVSMLLAGCSSGGSGPNSPSPSSVQGIRVGRAMNAPFEITGQAFGIHSYTTQPQVPTGTIRLACAPTWGVVEPSPGEFDWTAMDASIARAESWGFKDILFSMCGTPRWAGTPTDGPDEAVFGKGTAQPPRNMADWQAYVSAMVERYKGRIAGYEVWNEPTSPQFFAGTPAQMAQMTQVADQTIKAVDPAAFVLTGSLQTHRPDYYQGFGIPYLRRLGAMGWPVDGIAAHFYTPGPGTPADRVREIMSVEKDIDRLGAPSDLPLWDTEVNYDVSLPGGAPDGRITGDRAAGWTAQTFLDSWRTGIRRTYWYLWTQDFYVFPGIQMRIGDPSTTALTTLGTWLSGAYFDSCISPGDAVVCTFSQRGTTFRIAWAERGSARISLTEQRQVCPVTGKPCQARSGFLPLNEVPVRID